LEDETLAHSLGPTVLSLLEDRERLAKMSAAAAQLAQPNAAMNIVQELQQLVSRNHASDWQAQ
jgi:UDP-N-acetylglucosamine:LPS N-acetylglucosamine transferase